jgi:ribosomal protein L7/L12
VNESLIVAGVIVVAAVAVLFKRLTAVENQLTALSRLDAKLDALLKHSGIRFDPYQDVPPAVVEALARGQKIEAIKAYRQARGADLKEAKEFVEEVQRRAKS